MKVLKVLGVTLLALVCLVVCTYFGFFLLRSVQPAPEAPQLQSAQELFPVVEQEPVEEVPEEIPEEPVVLDSAQKAQVYLDAMSLEEKLWQMMFLTPEDLTGVELATQAGEMTRDALAAKPVGGLCYFAGNLETRGQVMGLLAATRSYAKTPLFLATDEEGGMVSRLGSNEELGVTKLEPASYYGTEDVLVLRQAADTLAVQMKELGFNMNFAPVADVLINPDNTEIGNRAYSGSGVVSGVMSATMAEALQRGGIVACLKHFPGHGSTQSDSHEGTSVSTRTAEQLREEEFVSFGKGIDSGVHFVMMSHLVNENLSALPSSLAPETVGLLRKELGFEGVIITDSLKMGAVTEAYSAGEAAVLAVTAGCDMLLMPQDVQEAYDALSAAVQDGTLPESRIDESVLRILTVKYEMGMME